MGKFFYQRLAVSNMKKNARFEIPYLLTGIVTVCAFFMISSLAKNPDLASATSYAAAEIMRFACYVVGIFSAVMMFYTDSFLMKRRKKELGLYNILGMEKRHIGFTLFFETLYSVVISLTAGILAGMLFSKLMYMVCSKLINLEIGMKYAFSLSSFVDTVVLFSAIFFASFLIHLLQLKLNNPIEMLKGSNVGEKEPKAKWLLAVLGIICIGTGYYISITTENPLQALTLFFVAVLLVIFGTYLLFTSVTISLLKLLKKNKKYYYKANHFTAVSGLMYRMKQNAVGLASICILLTMVLVMVSTTFSMYTGIDTYLKKTFKQNSYISYTAFSDKADDEMKELVLKNAEKKDLEVEDLRKFTVLSVSGLKTSEGFSFDLDKRSMNGFELSDVYTMTFIPESDYEAATGEKLSLEPDEVAVYGKTGFPFKNFSVAGVELTAVEKLDSYPLMMLNDEQLGNGSYYFVTKDLSAIEKIYDVNEKAYGNTKSNIQTKFQFDLKGSAENQRAAMDNIGNEMRSVVKKYAGDGAYSYSWNNKESERDYSMKFYGSFFFIGIFLGLIFTLGMSLMIYYKQLSEGYEDRERYIIMQKVGMTHREVRKSINSQVLIVFFLPLVTAVCHLIAAYPMLKRLLRLFNMIDVSRFGISTVAVIAVFSVIYFTVYKITSKIYYSIVSAGA